MRTINPQPIIIPVPVNNEYYEGIIEKLRKEVEKLNNQKAKRKRRTEKELENQEKEYSEFKKDDKRKARPAESIKSYDEFLAIQNYFLEKGNIRDWAFWTVGVSLGVRGSDLTRLKIKSVLKGDMTFRDRISIIEKKTGKLNQCLITESIVYALTKYFDSISWAFDLNDYVFKSQKKCKLTEQSGWRIISDAGKALNMNIVMGSHTMRKNRRLRQQV